MDLNNLALTSRTLQNLYHDALIARQEEAMPKTKEIASLGKNRKNVLFLIANETHSYCGDEEMEMLTNLLSACRLSLDDIALVNGARTPLTHDVLHKQFQYKFAVCFGITCSNLGLPFEIPDFRVYNFADCKWLFNPNLKDFLQNPALKRDLWGCLKHMFEL